jgi:hypothetical protein
VQHQLEVLQRIVNPNLNIEIGHLGSVDESGKRLSEGIVRFNFGLAEGVPDGIREHAATTAFLH